jgi:hypothetical protein
MQNCSKVGSRQAPPSTYSARVPDDHMTSSSMRWLYIGLPRMHMTASSYRCSGSALIGLDSKPNSEERERDGAADPNGASGSIP